MIDLTECPKCYALPALASKTCGVCGGRGYVCKREYGEAMKERQRRREAQYADA